MQRLSAARLILSLETVTLRSVPILTVYGVFGHPFSAKEILWTRLEGKKTQRYRFARFGSKRSPSDVSLQGSEYSSSSVASWSSSGSFVQETPQDPAGELPAQRALGHEVPAASCSLVCLEVESSDEEMTRLEENSPLSPPGELAKSLIPEFDAAIYEMETLPCADLTCPDTLLDELDFESPCEAG